MNDDDVAPIAVSLFRPRLQRETPSPRRRHRSKQLANCSGNIVASRRVKLPLTVTRQCPRLGLCPRPAVNPFCVYHLGRRRVGKSYKYNVKRAFPSHSSLILRFWKSTSSSHPFPLPLFIHHPSRFLVYPHHGFQSTARRHQLQAVSTGRPSRGL